VKLPEGVEKSVKTKPNGKTYTYYYWNPGRGTERQAERIKLPNPEKQPRLFWAEVERRPDVDTDGVSCRFDRRSYRALPRQRRVQAPLGRHAIELRSAYAPLRGS
jgi:hypothetical protein